MLKVLCLLGLVSAAAAYICCPPQQWEGNMGMIIGSSIPGVNNSISQGYVKLVYDAIGMRYALDLNFGGRVRKQIQMFGTKARTGVQYEMEDGACKTTPLPMWGDQACIPDNATHMGDSYYGVGSNRFFISVYNYVLNNLNAYVSVTRDCIPIGNTMTGNVNGIDLMISVGYTDMTVGIKDMSVFNIPSVCPRPTTPEPTTRQTSAVRPIAIGVGK